MNLPEKLEKYTGSHFDYVFLMDALAAYAQPHAKITYMLKSGLIVRVKKGLYVFGPQANKPPYSQAVLANLIYGPSYISFEYALAYHQMIPERVSVVTSITTKRRKQFHTPVGTFVYEHTRGTRYPFGVSQVEMDGKHRVLMASKEKALIDLLNRQRLIRSIANLKQHLLDNLRITKVTLQSLSVEKLKGWIPFYSNKSVLLLPKCIEELNE